MTPSLRTIGEACFGPSWRKPLARALSVTDRHLRRWLTGASPVPPHVWPACRALALARCEVILALAGKLPKE
jgi:hypothetical protein